MSTRERASVSCVHLNCSKKCEGGSSPLLFGSCSTVDVIIISAAFKQTRAAIGPESKGRSSERTVQKE